MGEHGALIDANAVIDRMRVVTDTSTDIALCAKLQLGTSAVSTWRRRQSVPYAECVNLALRYGVSRRTRLVAVLLPPSVLARWRAGFSARYAATITAVGKRRDALTRTVSPRRLLASRTGR